jgi:hypothetical protein
MANFLILCHLAGQQASPFANGSQRIPQQVHVPSGQAVPGQYGIPSQPMAPQPLMQQLDQAPPQLTAPQGAGVPRQPIVQQQDPNIQYQHYGGQQQVMDDITISLSHCLLFYQYII